MDQYTRLETLMHQKAFVDLSAVEKKWVQQYQTAAEYDEQRQLLLAMKDVAPLPPKSLELQLMQSFREHHSNSATLAHNWLKPILWASALLVVFFIGRASSSMSMDSTNMPEPTIKHFTTIQKDTIYIDKWLPSDTVYIQQTVKDTLYVSIEKDLPIANHTQELMPILEPLPEKMQSVNVKEDQAIYDILVEVY